MTDTTTPIDKGFRYSNPVTHRTIDEVNPNWNLDDVPDRIYGKGTIQYGEDIWRNLITVPDGYEIIKNTPIKIGDIHFDIYGGWTKGGEDYAAERGHHAHGEGRWICWARKINNEIN